MDDVKRTMTLKFQLNLQAKDSPCSFIKGQRSIKHWLTWKLKVQHVEFSGNHPPLCLSALGLDINMMVQDGGHGERGRTSSVDKKGSY